MISHVPVFTQYIALQTGNQAINIAVTLGKDSTKSSSSEDPPTSVSSVSNHDCLQDSGEQETLAGLSTKNFKDGQLVSSRFKSHECMHNSSMEFVVNHILCMF